MPTGASPRLRDAWALDDRVVLPIDAVTAFDPGLHEATLESLRPSTVQPSTPALKALMRMQASRD